MVLGLRGLGAKSWNGTRRYLVAPLGETFLALHTILRGDTHGCANGIGNQPHALRRINYALGAWDIFRAAGGGQGRGAHACGSLGPGGGEFRQSEVQNLCLAPRRDENVCGFDVAMDDAFGMRRIERIGDLNGQVQRLLQLERPAGDAVRLPRAGSWKPVLRCSEIDPQRMFIFYDGAYPSTPEDVIPINFTLNCLEIDRPTGS